MINCNSLKEKKLPSFLLILAKKVLIQGDFRLTKFASNIREVLESVNENKAVNSSPSGFEYHSIPGLKWNSNTDHIGFPSSLRSVNDIPTKILLLSMIAKVYDPISAVSPITLPITIVMQGKSEYNWDATDNKEFYNMMQKVSHVTIPRRYKTHSEKFKNPSQITLHSFSDASKQGFSAVVYIRQIADDGKSAFSFVYGKSRVAPTVNGHIPQATFPELELSAATVLAKLVQKVIACIDISINETVYWCDSCSPLSCIKSTNRKFPVYWSNRLAIIYAHFTAEQWIYVHTKQKPADLGSRGISSKVFGKFMDFFINVPKFLHSMPEQWPNIPVALILEKVAIMKTNYQNETKQNDPLKHVTHYYSKLSKIFRTIARLLRSMHRVKTAQNEYHFCDYVAQAMTSLIRFEQKHLITSHLKRLKPLRRSWLIACAWQTWKRKTSDI